MQRCQLHASIVEARGTRTPIKMLMSETKGPIHRDIELTRHWICNGSKALA